ncbi:MAG: ribonuclease HII [Thermovirgaceae bacterium]|nr:ribonuclease HII [Thermovirgaceae bacterium]
MLVAGVDEAGRGPLAGPVVAAAVILERLEIRRLLSLGLNDSKKMSPASRERLFREMNAMGVTWRAQAASPARIDRDNILAATLWAMRLCVTSLPRIPDLVVVDGSITVPGLVLRQKALPRADGIVPAAAAASVVAKVLRDRVMRSLDAVFPIYGFCRHKGYPSREHVENLRRAGPCAIHRKSFHVRGWSSP